MRDDARQLRGTERIGAECGIVESGIFESRIVALNFGQQPGQSCGPGNIAFRNALSTRGFVQQQLAEISQRL